MYRTSLYISAMVAVAGLIACGGSSEEIVARVLGVGSISKTTLNHWIPIEASLIYDELATKPVPKGVMPDPPNYTACITYLKSSRQKIVETGPKPTITQLKSKCRQRYGHLKEYALNTLINWYWTIGKGAALGMKITDAEAEQRLKDVKKIFFPKEAQFKNYLKRTGQTIADMLFRSKVQLLEVKSQQRFVAMEKRLPQGLTAQQREKALLRLVKGVPTTKQWVARTSCRPGYVTSDCKQYRGTTPPGIPN